MKNKAFVSILEMIVVVATLVVAFSILFPGFSYQNRWEQAFISLKGRDLILTSDRLGNLYKYSFNETALQIFLDTVVPTSETSLIHWSATDGAIKPIVTVACICTEEQKNALISWIGRFKVNNRNIDFDIVSSSLDPIYSASDVLLIWGDRDLTPYKNNLENYLKAGNGIVEIMDLKGNLDVVQESIFGLDKCGNLFGEPSCGTGPETENSFAIPTPSPTTQTATFSPSPNNYGHIERHAGSYPPGPPSTVWLNQLLAQRGFNGATYFLLTGIVGFDTSSLADDATITGATLQFTVPQRRNDNNRNLAFEWYNSGWPIDETDWTETAGTSAHAGTPINSLGGSIVLTGYQTNINKGGMTVLRTHISGGIPEGNNFAELANLVLVITYTTQTPTPTIVTSYESYKYFHHIPMTIWTPTPRSSLAVASGITPCSSTNINEGIVRIRDTNYNIWICNGESAYLDTGGNPNEADRRVLSGERFPIDGQELSLSYIDDNVKLGIAFPEYKFKDFLDGGTKLYPKDQDVSKVLLSKGAYVGTSNPIPVVIVNEKTSRVAWVADFTKNLNNVGDDHKLLLSALLLWSSDKKHVSGLSNLKFGHLTSYVNVANQDMYEVYRFDLGLGFPF